MNRFASLLKFLNLMCVDSLAKSGGICMLWTDDVQVEVLEFDTNMIAIKIIDSVCSWNFVGFYGPPHKYRRKIAWENLFALLDSFEGPWVCLGDFNVILEDSEKEGGRVGSSSTPNYFKDLMFELGSIDLGFVRKKFTWSNRRWGKGSIRERLD